MAIETVEDIVEEIADRLGLYGACKAQNFGECPDDCTCRPNFTGGLLERIRRAVAVEQKLKAKEPAWLSQALNEGDGSYKP